ncbi:MAG: GAF domain-containing protein, partial [Anaerolineae bacterium]|jgi:PAS domain S-box-containing protein
VESIEVDAFNSNDEQLLSTLAAQAAVAIQSARRYQRAQREIAERQRAEAALQESERQKVLILNTAQEMFTYYDRSLTIQWANRATGESIGLDPEELVGQHCYEVFHQRSQPCPGCPVLKARETGEPQEAEITTTDGRVWFLRGYPVFDEKGEITALVEFGRDITARKRAELESRRRNEELAALHKTGQALTSTLDLDQVLNQVLAETREILAAEAASVLLYEDATRELVFAAAVGTASDGLVGARMPATEGVAGWAMQNAQPVLVRDAREDPRFYNGIDQITGLTTRSLLAVPLIAKGDVIGVLEAVKRTGDAFDERDLQVSTTLAGSAATAIENARLYEQTARRLAHTQTLRAVMQAAASTLDFDQVVERTIDAIHRVLDIGYLGLALPHPSGQFLTVHPAQIGFGKARQGLRLPVEGSVCGRAYATGKSVRIDDVRLEPDYVATIPELRSELAVPVPMEGKVVAVLNVESQRLGAFGEDDQQTLEAIAAQLGVALKNTQLYQAEQRRREVAEALGETSRVVNSSLRQDEVLPRILDQLAQVVDYDSSFVLLDTGDRFEVVAARGFEDPSMALETSFTPQLGDLFSKLAQERRPVVIEDVHLDQRWHAHPLDEEIRGWIGAPLLVRDEIIGILAVDSQEPGAYTPEDGELVFTFASHVAVALENARLYEAEREQRRLLEQSQAQLVQSEKLAATGRLAASLAHEINNPLQAIHNGLQLLLTFPMNREEQREYLQMADEEVERLMEMVARILDFARRPERRMQPTQLNDVVEKVLALAGKYLQHRHIVLERDLAADLPPLLATPDELGQVFLNMIINALDAMPEGGTLRVSTRLAKDGRLTTTFADTGQGIAPEHIDRVFEPFFSTKEGGTGLGLSVSYNVIKRHGGEIAVESTLGEGSRFTVWLPASRRT